MEVRLRRLGPNSKIKILEVPEECGTKIWLAGRGTRCQIYTKSKFASRQHFSITYREQKYFISDLRSANGTFVNDEKLVCEKPLPFGSVISVGVPSKMCNSPDCIVYVFEPNSGVLPAEKQIDFSTNGELQIVEDPKTDSASVLTKLEYGERTDGGDPKPKDVNGCVDVGNPDQEKTLLNDSSSSDVVLILSPVEANHEPMSKPKPAKRRKLGMESPPVIRMDCEDGEYKPEVISEDEKVPVQECYDVDDDLMAYEALTQVDEPEVKAEPDLLNYSLTEELIEISDSEDDWSPNLKPEEGRSPEGGDEDDDVVFLEAIIRSKEPRNYDAPPVACKVEDDLTEVDKKWLGRLLKVESESDFFRGSQEAPEVVEQEDARGETCEAMETVGDAVDSVPERSFDYQDNADETVAPCEVGLSRLSTNDAAESGAQSSAKTFPRVEVPKTIDKGVVTKKSVTFDMVPQIKYFEVPSRPKLSASEKGRLRFTRIIFNICNWNTHWLEECKRVAPDKEPPDICEERLRKIPKKFPSHSEYMGAFIPAMLLHLWNRVKDQWVNSGGSGFRQTVSCDSSEDYHSENLSVYKCTGLVQNVDAHKELLREGHLVLLRLHQSPNPEFVTPASEKYSKKLGYLVFGFVESRIYERFHKQSLHHALAERCGSVVGDLHIVRLTILVKKRPSFLVDKRKLIQLTVLQRISQEIRTFRGICFLPDSPLCSVILKPTKIEPFSAEPPKKERIVFKGPLDDVQSDIVRKLSYGCSCTSSFLYSVHGAAGTGKGQVIAALILQLLCGDEWKRKRPKIIYCTQWSIPLDEMVMKLRDLSETADEPFNMVRVGAIRDVKPEVRDLCLTSLAGKLRASEKWGRDGRRSNAEMELLKEADLICTTCPSAGISKMCSAFEKLLARDRSRKVICVIDEAMSCSERDSVIPLLLGVTHLILVGDIYQLEPCSSGERTHSLGLDMPLFWRIYKNFTSLPKELWPIYILKTEYRMNSALSKFTSFLIYNTPLQKPAVSLFNRIANIKTHLLLVDKTPENIAKEEKETREARIVSVLGRAVTRVVNASGRSGLRFAVIASDARQVESLQVLLPKREFAEIEIDQLQAVQGREFDVVTFVYDGRKILTSWLATALTRARSSLFVFASQQSLSGHPLIRRMAESAEKYHFLKYVRSDMTPEEFEEIITA